MYSKKDVFMDVVYKNRRYIYFVLILIIGILPLMVKTDYFLNLVVLTFFYAALAGAWNIVGGYAGQFSVGHCTFFGIGAYTSTLLFLNFGISPWIGMAVGGVLAAIAGIMVGWPCFRLAGPYFVLATLAIGEIMKILATYFKELTNGSVGLDIMAQSSPQNFLFTGKMAYAYVALIFMLVVVTVSYKMGRSKIGYYLIALREDQEAAESLGIFSSRYKIYAMIISSFFTGMAGTFYAQYFLFIDPFIVFSVDMSIQPVLMTIIGGSATVLGPVVGAMILIPLDGLLRLWIGQAFSGLSFIIYGLILILVVILMPRGLVDLIQSKVQGSMKQDEK
jgi:branched-chain amino acid transport system permease protein